MGATRAVILALAFMALSACRGDSDPRVATEPSFKTPAGPRSACVLEDLREVLHCLLELARVDIFG